jgi:hypothetical protein
MLARPPPLFPPAPSFLFPRPLQFGSSYLGELHQRFNYPEALWAPTNSYDKANEKNGSARPPACVRFVPRNTLRCSNLLLIRPPLDTTFLAGGVTVTVTLMACLVFPVACCPLLRWP